MTVVARLCVAVYARSEWTMVMVMVMVVVVMVIRIVVHVAGVCGQLLQRFMIAFAGPWPWFAGPGHTLLQGQLRLNPTALERAETENRSMTDGTYTPPKVWTWDAESGGTFASINRPVAGPTHEKPLPVGKHPLQLYSMATPNGVKVTILLEELLERGFTGAEYDAHLIRISEGDQFGDGFVEINPNSKIPALLDRSESPGIRVFESGAILLHLAEKFGAFIPSDPAGRAECLSWLFWQMGAGPYVGGGFGHFYAYAPEHYEYPINRFTMEVKRQLDVLDRQLAERAFIAGDEYTIADMAIWPWYGALVTNRAYDAAEFLQAHTYTHVVRWTEEIGRRPAVQRGRMVNRTWGDPHEQLHERHDASDFQLRTQDKLETTPQGE